MEGILRLRDIQPDGPMATALNACGAPCGDRWRGLATWQVRRVTSHMLANLGRPVTLAELANLVGLSRAHFCTAFRLATGRTPAAWLTDARIGRALELLAERKLSITEIALEVGYDTPSSFTFRFRRRMGFTPSDYRRAC